MSEIVVLLSGPTNYAVVQLPGRKFPGVVIQGDSLHAMVGRLAELQKLAGSNPHLKTGTQVRISGRLRALTRSTPSDPRRLRVP